jgi:hypothetical protein
MLLEVWRRVDAESNKVLIGAFSGNRKIRSVLIESACDEQKFVRRKAAGGARLKAALIAQLDRASDYGSEG